MVLPVLAFLLLAAPAAAQAVTAEEFAALAEGRTLRFTLDGAPFGAEQYLGGRRSLWRFEGGGCLEGRWWAERGLIFFRYEDDPAAECWRFARTPAGMTAALVEGGAETGFVLELGGSDTRPLDCPGPDIGT
jgi:hypothetical protein